MTDQADGPLRILERLFAGLIFAASGNAILQQGAGDTEGVEVFANLRAFMLDGQNVIATAGCDDHAGAVGLLRLVDRDGGLGDIGHTQHVFVVLRRDGQLGLGFEARRLRRAIGPELDRDGLSSLKCEGTGQKESDESSAFHVVARKRSILCGPITKETM